MAALIDVEQLCPPPNPCNKCHEMHKDDCPCKLKPYGDGNSCGPKMTPHHVVPDFCFRQPKKSGEQGEYYNGSVEHEAGLCICVEGGKGQRTPVGNHYLIHQALRSLFKKNLVGLQKPYKAVATLGEIEDQCAYAVKKAIGCDPDDIKRQLRAYHDSQTPMLLASTPLRVKAGKEVLRPDSYGTAAIETTRGG